MTQLRQGFVGLAPLTYTKVQLMQVLQQSRDEGFYRLLEVWQAHGFPPRLPRQGHSHALWSRPAVNAWMNHWGKTEPKIASAPVITIDTRRQQAEARHVN